MSLPIDYGARPNPDQRPVRETVGPVFTTLISDIRMQIKNGILTPPNISTNAQVLNDLGLMESMLNIAIQHPEELSPQWRDNNPPRRNLSDPDSSSPYRLSFYSKDRRYNLEIYIDRVGALAIQFNYTERDPHSTKIIKKKPLVEIDIQTNNFESKVHVNMAVAPALKHGRDRNYQVQPMTYAAIGHGANYIATTVTAEKVKTATAAFRKFSEEQGPIA